MKNPWNLFTDYLGGTILHPQFLIRRFSNQAINEAQRLGRGKKIIDIGCGRMPYRKELEKVIASYTGVDHPKISSLYKSHFTPDVLADIEKSPLPLPPRSFDIALLLEVIEYLENPLTALKEIHRVLKKDGFLIITSPFLYPLHDTPYDRNRFSNTALKDFLLKTGFKVIKIKANENFFDFWTQTLLVFIFKNLQKGRLFLLIPFFLVLTPFINLFSLCLSALAKKLPANKDFPLSYFIVAKKK